LVIQLAVGSAFSVSLVNAGAIGDSERSGCDEGVSTSGWPSVTVFVFSVALPTRMPTIRAITAPVTTAPISVAHDPKLLPRSFIDPQPSWWPDSCIGVL